MIRPKVLRDGFRLVAEKGLAARTIPICFGSISVRRIVLRKRRCGCIQVTDDVSIVEAMGLPVFITKGEYTNLKVWRRLLLLQQQLPHLPLLKELPGRLQASVLGLSAPLSVRADHDSGGSLHRGEAARRAEGGEVKLTEGTPTAAAAVCTKMPKLAPACGGPPPRHAVGRSGVLLFRLFCKEPYGDPAARGQPREIASAAAGG